MLNHWDLHLFPPQPDLSDTGGGRTSTLFWSGQLCKPVMFPHYEPISLSITLCLKYVIVMYQLASPPGDWTWFSTKVFAFCFAIFLLHFQSLVFGRSLMFLVVVSLCLQVTWISLCWWYYAPVFLLLWVRFFLSLFFVWDSLSKYLTPAHEWWLRSIHSVVEGTVMFYSEC